jgi:hypothetical protein
MALDSTIAETDANLLPRVSGDDRIIELEPGETRVVRSRTVRGVRVPLGFALLGVGVAATAALPAYGVYLVVRYLLKG